MPLKRCTNAEGKQGWSWGNGGCQVAETDEESKKQAIRVGLKVEGPKKFSKIMKKEKGWTKEDIALAQEVINEEKPKGWYESFAEKTGLYATKTHPMNEEKKEDEDEAVAIPFSDVSPPIPKR